MAVEEKVNFSNRVSVLESYRVGLDGLRSIARKPSQKIQRLLSKPSSNTPETSKKEMKRTETWFSNTGETTIQEGLELPQAPSPNQKSFVISVIKNIALLLALGALIGIVTAIAFTLYHRISQDEYNLPTELGPQSFHFE